MVQADSLSEDDRLVIANLAKVMKDIPEALDSGVVDQISKIAGICIL
jgi:hypothetical protein